MKNITSFKTCLSLTKTLLTLSSLTVVWACAPELQNQPENSFLLTQGRAPGLQSAADQEKIIGVSDLLPVTQGGENLPDELRPLIGAIGQLNIGCTATHIGHGLILTAGHCVTASPRSSSVSCRLLAVVWGNIGPNPEKPLKVSKCREVVARSSSAGEDFALLRVENPPEAAIAMDTRGLSGEQHLNVTMLSFPRMRPMEWSGLCALRPYKGEFPSSSKFFHSCDSEGGSSGAAIIAMDTLSIVGIHGGSADEFNYGTFSSVLNSNVQNAIEGETR